MPVALVLCQHVGGHVKCSDISPTALGMVAHALHAKHCAILLQFFCVDEGNVSMLLLYKCQQS